MIKKVGWYLLLLLCITTKMNAQISKTDSLLALLNKSAEDTGRVQLYANLSSTVRFTDPAKAIEYGQQGILLARKLDFTKGLAACYLNVSTAYIYSDKLDTALLFLDTALVYAHKVGDANRLGLAYLNRADIYRQTQDYKQSLKDCDTALSYADKTNNDDVRARVNQTIGSIYYQQETYSQAIVYCNKALMLYRKVGNLRMTATMLNNLGLIYKTNKEFEKAITVTAEAIHITDSLKDITNRSIYTGNLSDVYFEIGNYAKAEKYADTALLYATLQNNEKLMAIAWNFQGNVYVKQKRLPEAIQIVEKAAAVFQKLDATDRIYSTQDLLAEAYSLNGNYEKAFKAMLLSKAANDSLVKWRYDDDIVAMQTKFRVDEKDKEILLLAKDKELQQQKLQRRSLLMIGSAVLALLALCGTWLLMNRNKLRQRMKEMELRNQIAADLHDEVGSSLSSIHMLSQMATQQEGGTANKDILARMSGNAKETMDKMGDIVWMIKPGESEGASLKQRMERFAYEICSSKNIGATIELNELEKVKLTMEQRKNFYLIFKEAINNAVKYSGTEKADVIVTTQNKQVTLQVKDYGKGFDPETTGRGNGLDNMKNRAAELNGKLDISSEIGKGTTVQLIVLL